MDPITNNQEIQTCAICLYDLNPNDNTSTCPSTPISHIFHQHCIQNWATRCRQQDQNTRCPICRISLETETDRPVTPTEVVWRRLNLREPIPIGPRRERNSSRSPLFFQGSTYNSE